MAPTTQDSEDSDNLVISTYEIVGISIIVVGVTICAVRSLYKMGKRKKQAYQLKLELEPELEPRKKTAADHLGEIKEATQKVLRPLKVHTTESRSPLDNSSLFSLPREKERKSLSYIDSTRTSKTFSREIESRPNSSRYSFKYNFSRIGSLRRNSSIIKPQKRLPPPPPPSPLIFQDDIIEVDPMSISLLNKLLSNTSKSSSKSSSKTQSRMGSRTPSLNINPSIPSQSTSTPSSQRHLMIL